MSDKTGAEIDQAQMVQVRNVLHAAGECHNYETDKDIARVLRERDELRETIQTFLRAMRAEGKKTDELRAEVERLRAALEKIAGMGHVSIDWAIETAREVLNAKQI